MQKQAIVNDAEQNPRSIILKMPPRSKRQRKQKDRISLKGKQRAIGTEAADAE